METAHPFETIPHIPLPGNYPVNTGPFLVRMYEQFGPVFRTTYLGNDLVFLIGPEANRFILLSDRHRFLYQEGWGKLYGVVDVYGHGLLTLDGTEHEQQRRFLNPAFATSYMHHYIPLMNRIICQHIAAWKEMSQIDLYQEMRKITFDVAARSLLGLSSPSEIDHFRELFVHLLMQGMHARTSRLKDDISHLLQVKILESRVHPTSDVLGLLVQARDEEGIPLSDQQIIAHLNILLVAGHETSTSLGTWLLYLLSQHPHYMQRVYSEQEKVLAQETELTLQSIKQMKLLDNALSEAERMYPPIAIAPRGVLESFVFNGYVIPSGVYVAYAIAATHMLPGIFAHPQQFDPDRFSPPREEQKKTPFALVGFGAGPRMCIGINFAKIELKMIVTHILRQYDLLLVPGQELIQFYRATGMPLHGIKMHVRPKNRSDSVSHSMTAYPR